MFEQSIIRALEMPRRLLLMLATTRHDADAAKSGMLSPGKCTAVGGPTLASAGTGGGATIGGNAGGLAAALGTIINVLVFESIAPEGCEDP